jgi:hypothetical protein
LGSACLIEGFGDVVQAYRRPMVGRGSRRPAIREQRKRDRRFNEWGVKQPAIIACLDEEAVRSLETEFPIGLQWNAARAEASVTLPRTPRTNLAVQDGPDRLAGRPFDVNLIHQAVSHMQAHNISASGNLRNVMTQIITATGSEERSEASTHRDSGARRRNRCGQRSAASVVSARSGTASSSPAVDARAPN